MHSQSYESESDRSEFNLESCRALFSKDDDWISLDTFINYCRINCHDDAQNVFGDLETKSGFSVQFPGPEDPAEWRKWLANLLMHKNDDQKTLLCMMVLTVACMKCVEQLRKEGHLIDVRDVAVDQAWINAFARVIQRGISNFEIAFYLYEMMNTNFKKEIVLGVVRFITPEDAKDKIKAAHDREMQADPDPTDYKYYVIPAVSSADPKQIEVIYMEEKIPLDINSLIINQGINDSLEDIWKISSENRNLFYGHLIGCRVNSAGIVTIQSQSTTVTAESITLGCYALAIRNCPLKKNNPFFRKLRELFSAKSQNGWMPRNIFIEYCRECHLDFYEKFFGDLTQPKPGFRSKSVIGRMLACADVLKGKSPDEQTLLIMMTLTDECERIRIAQQINKQIDVAIEQVWIETSAELVRKYRQSPRDIAHHLYIMLYTESYATDCSFGEELLTGAVRFISSEEARREIGNALSKHPFYTEASCNKKYAILRTSISILSNVTITYTEKSKPFILREGMFEDRSQFWKIFLIKPYLVCCHLVGCRENAKGVIENKIDRKQESLPITFSGFYGREIGKDKSLSQKLLREEESSMPVSFHYPHTWASESKPLSMQETSLSEKDRSSLIKDMPKISVFTALDQDANRAYHALRELRKARDVPPNELAFSLRVSRRYPYLLVVDIQGRSINQKMKTDAVSLWFAYSNSTKKNGEREGWRCLKEIEVDNFIQNYQKYQFLELQINSEGDFWAANRSEFELKKIKEELACALWSIADCRLDAKHYLPRPPQENSSNTVIPNTATFFQESKPGLTPEEQELARKYIWRARETQDVIISFESSGKGPMYVLRLLNLYECAEAIETKTPAESFGRCYEVGLDEIKKWVENEKSLREVEEFARELVEVEELARELLSGPN